MSATTYAASCETCGKWSAPGLTYAEATKWCSDHVAKMVASGWEDCATEIREAAPMIPPYLGAKLS